MTKHKHPGHRRDSTRDPLTGEPTPGVTELPERDEDGNPIPAAAPAAAEEQSDDEGGEGEEGEGSGS